MVKKSSMNKSGQKTIELRRKKQNTAIMQPCNTERTLLKGILPRKRK